MIFTPLFPLIPYAIAVAVAVVLFVLLWIKTRKTSEISTWSWVRRGLALALVAFIGFGPATLEPTTENVRVNLDVYLVVDRTGSMAAEDYDGQKPRLVGVKSDIKRIAAELTGARFSVISFDSASSRQLPLTTDVSALQNWTNTLTQEITFYSAGSNMNRVLGEVSTVLKRGRDQNPLNKQLVFFMTDGENTSDEPRASFSALKSFIDGGAVLGYGTKQGGRMKRYDPLLEKEGYIPDLTQESAKDAISVIDEGQLRALAHETGLKYMHRTGPGPLTDVTSGLETELVQSEASRAIEVPQLLLWPFAAALCVLFLMEFAGVSRRIVAEVG